MPIVLPNIWIPFNFNADVVGGPVPAAVRFEPLTGLLRFKGSFVAVTEPANGVGLIQGLIPSGYRPADFSIVAAPIEYLSSLNGPPGADQPAAAVRMYPNGDVANTGIYTLTRITLDGIALIRGLL